MRLIIEIDLPDGFVNSEALRANGSACAPASRFVLEYAASLLRAGAPSGVCRGIPAYPHHLALYAGDSRCGGVSLRDGTAHDKE